MAPKAAMLETQEINEDALVEIQKAYQDDNKKQTILDNAIKLELVPKMTNKDQFLTTLGKVLKQNNFLTTTKLYKLAKATRS